jgi:hypothetical protein
MEAVQRATGRTLNTAWGMYTMRKLCSTDTFCFLRCSPSSPASSCRYCKVRLTIHAYTLTSLPTCTAHSE